jgi:hypothetical protein
MAYLDELADELKEIDAVGTVEDRKLAIVSTKFRTIGLIPNNYRSCRIGSNKLCMES